MRKLLIILSIALVIVGQVSLLERNGILIGAEDDLIELHGKVILGILV